MIEKAFSKCYNIFEVEAMKISTRTGDFKMTDAMDKRVGKDDALIECLGTLDELQANLMHAHNLVRNSAIKTGLEALTQELFRFGEALILDGKKLGNEAEAIEEEIEFYEKKLPEQKGFILPGRTLASSQIHIARTVARRLERRVVTLGRSKDLDPTVFAYSNRLSDLLYLYARAEEEL
jgi:cob(I)alamin adenosyltransferase